VGFLEPDWLAEHSEANIDAMLFVLGKDARQLYQRYLAEEVRTMRTNGLLPAWRAFDRAMCEIQQRTREGRR
jgi:hypothetical protein